MKRPRRLGRSFASTPSIAGDRLHALQWPGRTPEAPSRHKESHHVIVICCRCNADPAGRWKSPPAMIFRDAYWQDGSKRDDPVPACRDHLSPKREEEILRWEKDRGWKKGELR
jgi:hypothetical protein